MGIFDECLFFKNDNFGNISSINLYKKINKFLVSYLKG